MRPVHRKPDTQASLAADPPTRSRAGAMPWLPAVIVVAVGLRVALAVAMPCLSRDGVVFCDYARELGQRGPSLLRDPAMQQHPLYPAAILLAERIASLFGACDTPMTWQRCGQVVSIVSGVGLVLVVWALTARLVRDLRLPVAPADVADVAALLAAILPLNAALAADVMSDQTHALLYLAGLYMTMRMTTVPTALGTGLLSGLAFLTRPEGAAVVPAAWAAILARRSELGWRRVLLLALIVGTGFALLAGPYWALTGRISTKKSPLELLSAAMPNSRQAVPAEISVRHRAIEADAPHWARLRLIELPGYAVLPWVLYTLLRAGRVVVVAFGAGAVWKLRRSLLTPTLAGWTTAGVLHLSLTAALLGRWHYLAPRHLLVVVLLLIPFAALAFVHIWCRSPGRLRPWLRCGLVGCVLVLVGYAVRIPNSADAHLRRMANWIRGHLTSEPQPMLIGGRSQLRVAFYAELPFEQWSEAPDDVRSLMEMIANRQNALVLLEVGPGFERRGHTAALAEIEKDPNWKQRLRQLHEEPGPAGTRLILLERRSAAP